MVFVLPLICRQLILMWLSLSVRTCSWKNPTACSSSCTTHAWAEPEEVTGGSLMTVALPRRWPTPEEQRSPGRRTGFTSSYTWIWHVKGGCNRLLLFSCLFLLSLFFVFVSIAVAAAAIAAAVVVVVVVVVASAASAGTFAVVCLFGLLHFGGCSRYCWCCFCGCCFLCLVHAKSQEESWI